MFLVCHTVLSVLCSLVVTCWLRVGPLAVLYVMFSCIFFTFQYGVLGQVWYLFVLIPDICLLPYFHIFEVSTRQALKGNNSESIFCSIPNHEAVCKKDDKYTIFLYFHAQQSIPIRSAWLRVVYPPLTLKAPRKN